MSEQKREDQDVSRVGSVPGVGHGDLPRRKFGDSSAPVTKEHYVIRDVTDPKGVVRVLRDKWWWCVDGDPRKAVFFIGRGRLARRHVGSPQCNSNRWITERITTPFESAVVTQIQLAFVPIDRDEMEGR
jgi:hypothetical protein